MKSSSIDLKRLSAAIAWIRFPLIMCVVMLHCYCTVPLAPGNHSLFFKSVYLFGLWLGEFGVPAFFFISCYLFYFSNKTYQEKISSRVHTLLYPFLFWNSLFLVLYIGLFPIGHPQDILLKSIGDYGDVLTILGLIMTEENILTVITGLYCVTIV